MYTNSVLKISAFFLYTDPQIILKMDKPWYIGFKLRIFHFTKHLNQVTDATCLLIWSLSGMNFIFLYRWALTSDLMWESWVKSMREMIELSSLIFCPSCILFMCYESCSCELPLKYLSRLAGSMSFSKAGFDPASAPRPASIRSRISSLLL